MYYEIFDPLFCIKKEWFYEQFYENVTSRNTAIMRTSMQDPIDYNEINLNIALQVISPSSIISILK